MPEDATLPAPFDAGSSPVSVAATALPGQSYLEDFTQVLTHRIRNLLAGIEGFTDLLTDTLGTQEQRELALRILEGTARIEYVLADLQRYSQPVDMMRLPVRAGDMVEHVLSTLQDAELQRLRLEVEDEQRELTADPLLLSQALLLLVQNALEASAPDRPVRLHITFDDAEDVVRFDVWNEGTIDAGQAEKIFEPFFTTKASNLGIGLTLARRIASAHDGHLFLAANSPARGTCFTLLLPATVTA